MKKWIFAILCLIVDQLAKYAAVHNNDYVINSSASLGLLNLNNNLLIIITVIVIGIFVCIYLWTDSKLKIVLPLLIMMSSSNVLDRLFRGGVVDIFKISILPVFNIADLVITTIFVLLVVNYVNNQFKSR